MAHYAALPQFYLFVHTNWSWGFCNCFVPLWREEGCNGLQQLVSGVSEIDKNSLAWIGYEALIGFYGWSMTMMESNWEINEAAWVKVAGVVAEEAIKRYKASLTEPETPPKPRYANFLEVTRDLCR